jgi:uncharacterized protein YkwD
VEKVEKLKSGAQKTDRDLEQSKFDDQKPQPPARRSTVYRSFRHARCSEVMRAMCANSRLFREGGNMNCTCMVRFGLLIAPLCCFAASASAQDDALRDAEVALIKVINGERQKASVPDYKPNRRLMAAARLHANNMASLNTGGHVLEDVKEEWRRPEDRLAYVKWRGMTWGENVAWGTSNPEAIVRMWMNSEGHRKNLLSEYFGEIGVGLARGTSGYYVCAVFGSSSRDRSDVLELRSKEGERSARQGRAETSRGSAPAETWRYRFHEGRWWYWLPSNRWVVWDNGRWLEVR